MFFALYYNLNMSSNIYIDEFNFISSTTSTNNPIFLINRLELIHSSLDTFIIIYAILLKKILRKLPDIKLYIRLNCLQRVF